MHSRLGRLYPPWVELGNLGRKERLVTDNSGEPQQKHGGTEDLGDRVTRRLCGLILCPTVDVGSDALVLHRHRPFCWDVAPLGNGEKPWEEDQVE